jgi:hypothetical protein
VVIMEYTLLIELRILGSVFLIGAKCVLYYILGSRKTSFQVYCGGGDHAGPGPPAISRISC